MSTAIANIVRTPAKRYRLPGIEREGIAQLSVLETALWPLQGARCSSDQFATNYSYTTPDGRKVSSVLVRAPAGLRPIDELVLWGLLGATLRSKDSEPILVATPYWMLRHLTLDVGGSQYAELRDSLFRLAQASYQNDGFYNPETREHEHVAFQFLSILLPTVGGAGGAIDNDRCWRIEWNPAFFRFCRATGGSLLFDLDLYRTLTPAARRLFLKLKDRFWRSDRVFMNVDDLTRNWLGFASNRPLSKRKFDLLNCIRELVDNNVLTHGHGHTDAKQLFMKRGKGSYVVTFHKGEYFRKPQTPQGARRQESLVHDPLFEPLHQGLGIDKAAVRRLLSKYSRATVQRWILIADVAMNENPKGFSGFRISQAAFIIDGIQKNRTPPDWYILHEKERHRSRWEASDKFAEDDATLRRRYDQERSSAFQAFMSSPQGRRQFEIAIVPYLTLFEKTEPHRFRQAARDAAIARLERVDFQFPDFSTWASMAS